MAIDPLTGQSRVDPREQLAQTLLGQGLQAGPVETPMQGVGRLAQALVGAKLQKDFQTEQQEQAQRSLEGLREALLGGQGGQTGQTGSDAQADTQGQQQDSSNRLLAMALSSPEAFRSFGPAALQASLQPEETFTVSPGERVVTASGREVATGGEEPLDIESQFGAQLTRGVAGFPAGKRVTIARTNRGIGIVDDQKRLQPISTADFVPISRQEQGGPGDFGLSREEGVEVQDEMAKSTAALESSSELLKQIQETPGAGGLRGSISENVGGLIGQLPLIGQQLERGVTQFVSNASPEEVTEFRVGAQRQVAQQLSEITGEESGRYTTEEQRIARQALKGLTPESSFDQIVAAQKAAMRANLMALTRQKEKIGGEPLFNPEDDQSINQFGDQLLDLGFEEEEALDVIKRLMRRRDNPLRGGPGG